jgi:hypothetical protein
MRDKSRKARKGPDDKLTLAEGIAILATLSLLGGLCFGIVAV